MATMAKNIRGKMAAHIKSTSSFPSFLLSQQIRDSFFSLLLFSSSLLLFLLIASPVLHLQIIHFFFNSSLVPFLYYIAPSIYLSLTFFTYTTSYLFVTPTWTSIHIIPSPVHSDLPLHSSWADSFFYILLFFFFIPFKVCILILIVLSLPSVQTIGFYQHK
ncbi:hypothetical protein BCR41DRAFT_116835 [Lobosporangium transversale]|uniref:Uncharacterized protein n=1 Tax=Lobosporangium transversale TaxID=64571 RepID=A0A1Y2H3E9_9FUNG|nr:hypothetical protein BCR41DRAFT_116835 [Lobosporangium transversale]ORZ27602.1 hypothetical protein BCR41DRAFT_116835 [Lobosporangium transversale]|eukprot:XP_021885305.1 hypothetical protein BCR41DRAFT_116835 [Lobosporangium transversale]